MKFLLSLIKPDGSISHLVCTRTLNSVINYANKLFLNDVCIAYTINEL